jgi:hypothetical protein
MCVPPGAWCQKQLFHNKLNFKNMVTITGYRLAKNKDEKEFIALELQGDIEMVQSIETGNFYATARKASITSTFSEETAKGLVETKIAGKIVRVESDSYDFALESGELIKLMHRYVYQPLETEAVAPYNPIPKEKMFSLRTSLVKS